MIFNYHADIFTGLFTKGSIQSREGLIQNILHITVMWYSVGYVSVMCNSVRSTRVRSSIKSNATVTI